MPCPPLSNLPGVEAYLLSHPNLSKNTKFRMVALAIRQSNLAALDVFRRRGFLSEYFNNNTRENTFLGTATLPVIRHLGILFPKFYSEILIHYGHRRPPSYSVVEGRPDSLQIFEYLLGEAKVLISGDYMNHLILTGRKDIFDLVIARQAWLNGDRFQSLEDFFLLELFFHGTLPVAKYLLVHYRRKLNLTLEAGTRFLQKISYNESSSDFSLMIEFMVGCGFGAALESFSISDLQICRQKTLWKQQVYQRRIFPPYETILMLRGDRGHPKDIRKVRYRAYFSISLTARLIRELDLTEV